MCAYVRACVCVAFVVAFPNRIVKFQLNAHMKCNFNVQIFRRFFLFLVSFFLQRFCDFYFAFAYRALLNLICFTTLPFIAACCLPSSSSFCSCAGCQLRFRRTRFMEAFNFRFIRDSDAPAEESAD